MYKYGTSSTAELESCEDDLQRLFNEAIKHRDISITQGWRSDHDQDTYFLNGTSKLKAGESAHNTSPSRAVDAIPYPTTKEDWENRAYWIEWTSWIKGLATGMGIDIISGYDWDNDYDLDDQSFFDGPHFELAD